MGDFDLFVTSQACYTVDDMGTLQSLIGGVYSFIEQSTCRSERLRVGFIVNRHVYMFRFHTDNRMQLFDEAVVEWRWRKDYFLRCCPAFIETPDVVAPVSQLAVTTMPQTTRPMTQHKKFNVACRITQRLASLTSEQTGQQYTVCAPFCIRVILYYVLSVSRSWQTCWKFALSTSSESSRSVAEPGELQQHPLYQISYLTIAHHECLICSMR